MKNHPPNFKSPGTVSTPKFLGKDPSDPLEQWREYEIQAYIATMSHRAGYTFAAGMEGASKSKATAGRSKATGQTAGEPDLRYYLPNGILVMIELKCAKGKLSDVQRSRIGKLRDLGYNVCIVYASCPMNGWDQVKEILERGVRNVGMV